MKRPSLVPVLKELTFCEDVIRVYMWEIKPKFGDREGFPEKGIFQLSSRDW